MVHQPLECNRQHAQTMFLHNGLDECQGIECRVFEIPETVHAAHAGVFVTVTTRGWVLFRFDLAREKITCYWIIDDGVKAVASASRDELHFNRSG